MTEFEVGTRSRATVDRIHKAAAIGNIKLRPSDSGKLGLPLAVLRIIGKRMIMIKYPMVPQTLICPKRLDLVFPSTANDKEVETDIAGAEKKDRKAIKASRYKNSCAVDTKK